MEEIEAVPRDDVKFDPEHPYLNNRVIIMNGFTNEEIFAIMRTVKGLTKPGPDNAPPAIGCSSGDLVFAKTTEKSLRMILGELIIDMSGDHDYLKNNPPEAIRNKRAQAQTESEA